MRRWLILMALLVALPATSAEAQPVRDGKKLLSCPDPSVVDAHVGGYRYYMACTSDTAANVFPLRESNDLVHWKHIGSVFTKRNQPWWARHTPGEGHYWAPALYRIGNRWVLYFAAQHDPRRLSGAGRLLHLPRARPDGGDGRGIADLALLHRLCRVGAGRLWVLRPHDAAGLLLDQRPGVDGRDRGPGAHVGAGVV
jgi:hypothetical protein